MPGKRPRPTMKRTSSVSRIGSGSGNGDCSPLPEHSKEKLKPATSPVACTPRQVIGFHPKVYIEDESLISSSSSSSTSLPPQSKSPSGSGSPRSGLGDLLNGARLWGRREIEGVGLGIVAALHNASANTDNLEEVCKGQDEGNAYTGPGQPSKTSQAQHHHHRPSRTSASPFANKHTPTAHLPPCANSLVSCQQQADMDVDKGDTILLCASPLARQRKASISQVCAALNFLDSCYFCKRELVGRDIYMYRGDRAFCSPECRDQQIVNDERPEKCSSAAIRIGVPEASRHSSQYRNRVMASGIASAA